MPPKRKTSVLTDSLRKYLFGQKETGRESEDRRRIRDGIYMSVFDYHLILNELSIDDIRKALSEPEKEIDDDSVTEMKDLEPDVLQKFGTALPSLFGLPYIKVYDDERKAENQPLGWKMELYVEQGIRRALNRMGESVTSVNVDIDIQLGESLEDIADSDLTELDHDTLSQLRKGGYISDDQFAETWVAIKERNQSPDTADE